MKEEIRIGSLVRIKNTEQTALVVERISYDVAKKESYFTFEDLDRPVMEAGSRATRKRKS